MSRSTLLRRIAPVAIAGLGLALVAGPAPASPPHPAGQGGGGTHGSKDSGKAVFFAFDGLRQDLVASYASRD